MHTSPCERWALIERGAPGAAVLTARHAEVQALARVLRARFGIRRARGRRS